MKGAEAVEAKDIDMDEVTVELYYISMYMDDVSRMCGKEWHFNSIQVGYFELL